MDFINEVDPWFPYGMGKVKVEYSQEVHDGQRCPVCGGTDITELVGKTRQNLHGRAFVCNDDFCFTVWMNGVDSEEDQSAIPVVYGTMAVIDGYQPKLNASKLPSVKNDNQITEEIVTDAVLLVLKNDQKAFRHWLRVAMDINLAKPWVEDALGRPDSDTERHSKITLADCMKAHYEKNDPFERFSVNAAARRGDKGPGEGWLIYHDLLRAGFSLVNWRHVAEYFLSVANGENC